MRKGFFQVGIVILIASLFAGTLLVNKLKINKSVAVDLPPRSCSSVGITEANCNGVGRKPVVESGGGRYCDKDGRYCRIERLECNYNNFKEWCFFKDNTVCSDKNNVKCTKITTPTPTSSPSPSPTPSPTVKPTHTPNPTKTPTATKSPSPTPSNLSCNKYCLNSSQCASGLTCSWGRCRNPSCTKSSICICATTTPSPSPTIIPPTPTATAGTAKLTICKYKDENGNGYKDGEDHLMSWNFKYEIDGTIKDVNSYSWNIFKKGCVTVNVLSDKTIKVSEYGRNGWDESGVYADGARQSTWDYSYTSVAGQTKEVWFLNNEHKEGEPNSCNGTCGSNSNCKSEFYCYKGYCRNPRNPESSTCSEPAVLSATAPPELPKTGSSSMLYALGFMAMGGVGIYLYRKFKLV